MMQADNEFSAHERYATTLQEAFRKNNDEYRDDNSSRHAIFKRRPSTDNISIATALTLDTSEDEDDKHKAKIKCLLGELVQLKGEMAYIKGREDDYRFTIQTLVAERDLSRMELMQQRNQGDIQRCDDKRRTEQLIGLQKQIAQLQAQNQMLQKQRDEYRQDRQQLQDTLNRLFVSGKVARNSSFKLAGLWRGKRK